MVYILVSSTSQKEFEMKTLPEFPGEEHLEEFSHAALNVYADKIADFYIDDKGNVWDENMTFVGCNLPAKNGWGLTILKDYEPDDDDDDDEEMAAVDKKKQLAEEKLAEEQRKLIQEMFAQQFPNYTNKQESTYIDTPDRELMWIASMEKHLNARKKAAKKAQKQREKEKREAAEARKRAAYEEALSGHNDKISDVDNQIALWTAKRDALIKAREEFMSANREFTPKKKVNRKSPGRQCARWDNDALTWIRTRIKEKDGKVSQAKEYNEFMKAFPSSSRSKKSVINQISKQKTIWLRRESKAMAKEIGCLTQTYDQLFKMW